MLIINMSNTYKNQNFYINMDYTMLDYSQDYGFNCYIDDDNVSKLKKESSFYKFNDIHFIDSGNYHYLSYFFLRNILSDFELVLYDNHCDMGMSRIDDSNLSCGSWVSYSINHLNHLRSVSIIGCKKEDIEFTKKRSIELGLYACDIKNGIRLSKDNSNVDNVYISIDKDVLSTKYAITDWDQGNMELDYLINDMNKYNNIIGIDICGDDKNGFGRVINNLTNNKILHNYMYNFKK